MKYKIFASLHYESNEGWVWLSEKHNFESRSIIRIKSFETGKKVWCECRVIDDNFKEFYQKETGSKIMNSDSAIVIHEWYRKKLGIEGTTQKTGKEVELDIKGENTCWGKIRSQTQHPQTIVRVATWIAILSFILGVVSLFW